MPATIVIGAQWGDEGKGKIVDYLAQKMDMVVRFNGGPNAGHTVINQYGKFALHLVPSGIFNPEVICVMGNGMVINPVTLVAEIKELERRGIPCRNLRISNRAHLILPKHLRRDKKQEKLRGANVIGTTLQGIGPTYSDKAARLGKRVEDLPTLGKKYLKLWNALEQYVCPTEELIWSALDENHEVLLEGAQGTLLDIDWGTYPHVTSSVCTVNGALQGSGVPWCRVKEVIGVVKAYTTRIGSKDQPFPTEMPEELANYFREKTQEYGVTTGRPRRIGWLDAGQLRYAARINGFTGLAITRLDSLGFLPRVVIHDGYGRIESPGWENDIGHCREFSDLPERARAYVDTVSNLSGVPVKLISVGPGRDQIIIRDR